MRKLIYSMSVSLDGFIAGPDGEIDWAAPDQELHRFHNAQARELDAHLCGRRLYEEMLPWEGRGDDPSLGDAEREFAAIWQALPKIVFSTTLRAVRGSSRLAAHDLAAEVTRLKSQPGRDIAIGGATLAASAIALGLVDELRLFVSPVVLGGGTPFLPDPAARLDLELAETRTFGARVVYLRYTRNSSSAHLHRG